jgi:hypothetical protein
MGNVRMNIWLFVSITALYVRVAVAAPMQHSVREQGTAIDSFQNAVVRANPVTFLYVYTNTNDFLSSLACEAQGFNSHRSENMFSCVE